jgi:hypothetical protein
MASKERVGSSFKIYDFLNGSYEGNGLKATSGSSIKFDDFVHRSYTGIALKSVKLFEYVQFINHIMQISNAHNPLMHSCALIA